MRQNRRVFLIIICVLAILFLIYDIALTGDSAGKSIAMPESKSITAEGLKVSQGRYASSSYFDRVVELSSGATIKLNNGFSKKDNYYIGIVDNLNVVVYEDDGIKEQDEIFKSVSELVSYDVSKKQNVIIGNRKVGRFGEFGAMYVTIVRESKISVRNQKEYGVAYCLSVRGSSVYVYVSTTEYERVEDALQMLDDVCSMISIPVEDSGWIYQPEVDEEMLKGLEEFGITIDDDEPEEIYETTVYDEQIAIKDGELVIEFDDFETIREVFVTAPSGERLESFDNGADQVYAFKIHDEKAGTYTVLIKSVEYPGEIYLTFGNE